MSTEHSRHPDWPSSFKGVSFDDWKRGYRTVIPGEGLFASSVAPILGEAPHPEHVAEWRKANQATVATTARQFGLSEVQVLEATGRG